MKKHELILNQLIHQAKKKPIPRSQIEKIQSNLFPYLSCSQGRPQISSNWNYAFTLLTLAQHHKNNEVLQKKVAKHILENCVFPPSCWDKCLSIFSFWWKLESIGKGNDQSAFRNLGPNGLLQMIFLLSMTGKTKVGWENSLLCYSYLTAKSGGVSQMNLKTARHHVLITLLNNYRWIESLQIYQHTILQKEFPNPTATGYLIWRLGGASRWLETLSIYDISVRYLQRKLVRADSNHIIKLRKEWGTVFSMAIECASRTNPQIIKSMVFKLVEYNQKVSAKPIALLDGNFIRSIERLPKKDSTELFSIATHHFFLDHFKIIRGLVSRKRWMDALRTFMIVMKKMSTETEYIGLSRAEIGKSRMSLLHSATQTNVSTIVDCVNSVRTSGGRYTLNDSEIECIFSKCLQNDESTFWLYSLKVFMKNFASVEGKHVRKRLPTNAMISLLLQNKHLPWKCGLTIFSQWVLNGDTREQMSPKNSDDNNLLSVATNALLKLLYSSSINDEAEKVLLSILEVYSISLPAVFLQNSSEAALRCAFHKNPNVSAKTLFYILQQSESNAETERALLCLNLYLKSVFGVVFLGPLRANEGVKNFKIASVVPSSVHVECIRCIGRSGFPYKRKLEVTKEYLNLILCPQSFEIPPRHVQDCLYTIAYETVVTFLDDSAFSVSGQCRWEDVVRFLFDILEIAVERYNCIPPFYMFLPNQLDRLLPRLTSRSQQKRYEICARCCVSRKLITLVLQTLCKENAVDTPSKPLLIGLLKLCCRVLEFEELPNDESDINFSYEKTDLSLCALKIVECEIQSYGIDEMSVASISLLYRTISLSPSGHTQWSKVLEITASVLATLSTSEQNCGSAMKARKLKYQSSKLYSEFSNIFGWEIGLDLWYRHVPHEVLKNVSANRAAVDYCLSLPIEYD